MIRIKHISTVIVLFVIAIPFFAFTKNASGQPFGGPAGQLHRMPQHAPFWGQLTETQQTELRELIQELRNQNMYREAIHEAVIQKLNAWGIERPDFSEANSGPRLLPLKEHLTDEQFGTIQTLVSEMKAQEKSRKEIHEAVHAKLEEWNVEIPRRGFRYGHHGIVSQLNENQKEELGELIKSLRDEGKTHMEIHEAVKIKLDIWGISPPEKDNSSQFQKHQRLGEQKRNTFKAFNHPNPFNPSTKIHYTLNQTVQVSLRIFNTKGQLIKTLVNETQSTGEHTVQWDGTNDAGENVSAGMYFYRIDAGDVSLSQRMMLMK